MFILRSFPTIIVPLCAVAFLPEAVHGLWPQPRSLQNGADSLRLDPSFSINVTVSNAPQDLLDAAEHTRALLFSDQLGRLVVGRGADDLSSVRSANMLSSLTLSLLNGTSGAPQPIATEATLPIGSRDEGYSLVVPADGSGAVLSANSTLGLFRGLTTFSQLWYTANGTVYTLGVPVAIDDSPAYPYRGFMLDTARNYFPVSDIKRTLDACSWVHINFFHWHVVDSQSFPLVIPGFTDVAEKGGYSVAAVYSPDDVADIVSYAGARGIDVVVEIDTPGHTSAISEAYPEYIACAKASPWATYANEPPAGQLRLASHAAVNFTVDLLSAAAKLFPSTLFSTGTQQELGGKTIAQALDAFTQATHGALRSLGKTPVVWEEMVLNYNLTLSNDTIAMVWISSEDAAAVAAKGFRFIHAASTSFYLDCGAGEWVGNDPGGNSWCDPFKTWQNAYTFDPLANLSAAQAPFVLGGQQLLWTEQSGPENLDSIVWPRAAASAEVFWSGAGGNLSAALQRLHELGYRLRNRGVQAISLQPEWCALRPNKCDLTA
ncbi:N-acetylhexosaminidase [Lactarius quietus]|nr:N-acetylhexosaminidase [Lactarius quietus]